MKEDIIDILSSLVFGEQLSNLSIALSRIGTIQDEN